MDSPWSHLKRTLTDAEWAEHKAWRKTGQMRHVGETRADGLIFAGYKKSYPGGERWLGPLRFQSIVDIGRLRGTRWAREQRKDPVERARLNQKQNTRRATNPEQMARYRARQKQYRLEFPEMHRADAMRRYAAKRKQTHPENIPGVERTIYETALRVSRCTGIDHQVDHIIAVMRGGWHHHLNLQVIPRSLNAAKNADAFWDSETYFTWRDVPPALWPAQLAAEYAAKVA